MLILLAWNLRKPATRWWHSNNKLYFQCVCWGDANPLNYPVQLVIMGNGQGFSSEKPAFGLPGGGLGPDNRIQFYVGDNWKMRPNLTVTYGVRYVHDTGRVDSDLKGQPCSTIDQTGTFLNPTIAAAALAQCGSPNGNILDLWGQGLGNPVRTPAHNFGPTAGLVWDPTGTGKTVIRAGAGLYYENSIFNNNLFNRPGRLPKACSCLRQCLAQVVIPPQDSLYPVGPSPG